MEVRVPRDYHLSGPKITLGESNVPRVLLGVLQATLDTQTHQVVSGFVPRGPLPTAKDAEDDAMFDNKCIAGLKADAAFLQNLAGLQAASKDSKQVRRQKTVVVRRELEAERRNTPATNAGLSATQSAKHSLLPAIRLLCDFFEQLPSLPCVVCGRVLARSLEQDTPEQLLCGDWCHSRCVRAFMQQPPFDASKRCPMCGAVFSHRLWTENVQRSAEKNYVEKQRTADEVALIDDLFGLKVSK